VNNANKVYTIIDRFEWDPSKAAKNLEKHRITFAEAMFIFFDPNSVYRWNKTHSSEFETRYLGIGQTFELRILSVIFTLRIDHEEKEKIRIISARPANKKEKRDYNGYHDAR
jgi:uncharacterized DUF497 family protein